MCGSDLSCCRDCSYQSVVETILHGGHEIEHDYYKITCTTVPFWLSDCTTWLLLRCPDFRGLNVCTLIGTWTSVQIIKVSLYQESIQWAMHEPVP